MHQTSRAVGANGRVDSPGAEQKNGLAEQLCTDTGDNECSAGIFEEFSHCGHGVADFIAGLRLGREAGQLQVGVFGVRMSNERPEHDQQSFIARCRIESGRHARSMTVQLSKVEISMRDSDSPGAYGLARDARLLRGRRQRRAAFYGAEGTEYIGDTVDFAW